MEVLSLMFTCIGYQGLFRQCRLERQLGPVVDEGPSARLSGTSTPDPEAAALPKRRQFSAAYKRRIVREANACQVPGEIGALLRTLELPPFRERFTAWDSSRALRWLRVR
jgi:hypothetical protein